MVRNDNVSHDDHSFKNYFTNRKYKSLHYFGGRRNEKKQTISANSGGTALRRDRYFVVRRNMWLEPLVIYSAWLQCDTRPDDWGIQ